MKIHQKTIHYQTAGNEDGCKRAMSRMCRVLFKRLERATFLLECCRPTLFLHESASSLREDDLLALIKRDNKGGSIFCLA